HRHPYDEVQFIREGRARYVVEGKEFEAGAGDILVIKAGEGHSFECIGEGRLVQIDVHLSPTFISDFLHSAGSAARSQGDVAMKGKTALVTGSSRGIGAAIARAFAAAGAKLALHGRDTEALTAVREGIEQTGGRATQFVADLAKYDEIEAMRRQV